MFSGGVSSKSVYASRLSQIKQNGVFPSNCAQSVGSNRNWTICWKCVQKRIQVKIVAADGRPDQATQNALASSAHVKGRVTMTDATHLAYFD